MKAFIVTVLGVLPPVTFRHALFIGPNWGSVNLLCWTQIVRTGISPAGFAKLGSRGRKCCACRIDNHTISQFPPLGHLTEEGDISLTARYA
jgi:hypothetical protein